ncbi:MAG TPA: hypothetical protein DEB42_06055 [Jeotgalicoccus sp.]|nr:hypothetical protein [Jeotgalicoccus sp.]
MMNCQNCGETIEENIDICPSCGTFLYDDAAVIDTEIGLAADVPDKDILSEAVNYDEAVDNLPDDMYNGDALEKRELELERRRFGKSTE